MINFYCPI